MRRLWAISMGILILCFVSGGVGSVVSCSSDKAETGRADSLASQGPVFGFGVQLTKPYTFTSSEDSKTLYLNGLVYDGPGEEPPPQITVTESMRTKHELSVRAFEDSKQGTTYEERLARMTAVYLASPLVKSVRGFAQGIFVKWASDPDREEEVILPREEGHFDLAAYRERLVADFWRTINSGGMIAFGRNYHICVPAKRLPKTLEQVKLIQSGKEQEQLDVAGTALQNRRFLEDLYSLSDDPKEE